MAITDINISEELVTNAPSIKYRGEEGPKSPQEMEKMADLDLLREQYEQYLYDLEEQKPGFPPMSFEEFAISIMGDQSKGPILPSPEDPVNPFGPKPEGPVLPNRKMAGTDTPEIEIEMLPKLLELFREKFNRDPVSIDELKKAIEQMRERAAYGGIMGRDGRKQYGIGSFIRKLIPNELAKAAEVAAPVVAAVAPQFALPAALAAGLGKYDRTGKFGDALKSGAMTYGIGTLSPGVSGLRDMGPQSGMFTTQPFGGDYNITNLSERFFPKSSNINKISDMGELNADTTGVISRGGEITSDDILANRSEVKDFTKEKSPFSFKKLLKSENMNTNALLGILGLSAAAGAYTAATSVDDVLTDVERGSGLDSEIPSGILSIRTEVIEAMKDPSGKKLEALRTKYPFLGTQASKDVANMAMGGRIGFNQGLLAGPTPQQRQAQQSISTIDLDNFIDAGQGIKLYGGQPIIKNYYSKEDSGRRNEAFFEIIDPMTGSMSTISEVDFYEKYGKPNAYGGRINRSEGGIMDLGGMEKDYRNTGGFVDIGEYEKKDDVPARLSVNEFVMTADAVRGMGNGDIDLGAQRMENLMKNMENQSGAQQMFGVSERLSEVV